MTILIRAACASRAMLQQLREIPATPFFRRCALLERGGVAAAHDKTTALGQHAKRRACVRRGSTTDRSVVRRGRVPSSRGASVGARTAADGIIVIVTVLSLVVNLTLTKACG